MINALCVCMIVFRIIFIIRASLTELLEVVQHKQSKLYFLLYFCEDYIKGNRTGIILYPLLLKETYKIYLSVLALCSYGIIFTVTM